MSNTKRHSAMSRVDYHDIISRALDGSHAWSPERRQEAYIKIRTALTRRLHTVHPPLSSAELEQEHNAIDDALHSIEAVAVRGAHQPSGQTAETGSVVMFERSQASHFLKRLRGGRVRDEQGQKPALTGSPAVGPIDPAVLQLSDADLVEAGSAAISFPSDAALEYDLSIVAAEITEPETESTVRKETSMSRTDEINRVLRKLQSESHGIEGTALISEDGLMIASSLAGGMEETRVAGMAATLLSLGGRAVLELGRGLMQEVIVRGDHGYAIVVNASRGTLLLAVTNESSKLGMTFFDMREAAKSLQKVM